MNNINCFYHSCKHSGIADISEQHAKINALKIIVIKTILISCICIPQLHSIIRAQFEGKHSAVEHFLTHTSLLQKHGLEIVDNNPDVLFVYNAYNIERYSTTVPIIILERNAPASVKSKTRKALLLPHVKAVFKNKILRPKKINNKRQIMHIYSYHVLNKYAQKATAKYDIILQDHELDKIHAVMWDLQMSAFNIKKFNDIQYFNIDITHERPIDVFFAGSVYQDNHTTSIRHALMGWHRAQACKMIESIPSINALVLQGHHLPFDEYITTMQKSKIVVSPWAWGEWAFRDYEAIHCGAILVKPDTSFVQSYPDIYQNYITYIPCKPDFSDLPEIIADVLKNYQSYASMILETKELVKKSWDYDVIVKNFVDHVKMVLN